MKSVSAYVESSTFSSAVWVIWSWNGRITEEEIRIQLARLADSGIIGVVLRPASDMYPLYLSDEFWDLFGYLLRKCRDHGIQVLLGDDFTRLGESLYLSEISSRQNYRAARLTVKEEVNLERGDHFRYQPERGVTEYVVAVKRNKRKIYIGDSRTLYDGEELSDPVSWKVGDGHWKVIIFRVRYDRNFDGRCIPNFFSMKAGQSYVNHVLDPLKAVTLPEYQDVFKGVFLEVPAILPSEQGVPWDDDLLISKYRSRYKRNLIETIPSLFYDVADNEVKYRPHVYSFLQDTLYDRFPAVVDKWAKQNTLKTWAVGVESDRVSPSTALPCLFSQPGGEFDSVGTAASGGRRVNEIAALSLYSRARKDDFPVFAIVGRSNAMTGLSIGDIKQDALFHACNGAQELFIDGVKFNRNYRYEELSPQALSFGNPDFTVLPELVSLINRNIAFSRLCERYGEYVAVVYPSTSIMSDFCFSSSGAVQATLKNISEAVHVLQELGVNFEIVDEQMLLECDITAEGVRIKENDEYSRFTGVILPYARLINNSFFVKLEQMAKKKVALFFMDDAPEGSFDDGHSPSFIKRVGKLIQAKSKQVDCGSVEKLARLLAGDDYRGDMKTKGLSNPSDLWKKSVAINGVEGYWFFNSGTEDVVIAFYPYENTDDDEDGDRYISYDISQQVTEPIELDTHNRDVYTLFPGESRFISFDEDAETGRGEYVNKYRIKLKEDRWQFQAASLNSFPLSRWSSKIGINRNNGRLTYYSEGHFVSNDQCTEAYLVFLNTIPESKEGLSKRFKVSVNGNELSPITRSSAVPQRSRAFFDDSTTLLVYDLSRALIKGNNRVLILSSGESDLPDPVKYPPFVAVDMPVEKSGKVWTIRKNKKSDVHEWGKSGYPYLIGTGEYAITFEVPKLFEKIYLNFTRLSGSAGVRLNDVTFDPLKWSPYRIDITDYVRTNERNNLVVSVRNTLDVINRLSAERSGILGPVYLDIYGDKSTEKEKNNQ
ncbi:MAG: hypothetical protein ACQEQV_00060 [Fibrobacterota bacterium]